jgi:hypothetical protein
MIKDRFVQKALIVFIHAPYLASARSDGRAVFVLTKGLILGIAGIGVVI